MEVETATSPQPQFLNLALKRCNLAENVYPGPVQGMTHTPIYLEHAIDRRNIVCIKLATDSETHGNNWTSTEMLKKEHISSCDLCPLGVAHLCFCPELCHNSCSIAPTGHPEVSKNMHQHIHTNHFW